MELTAEKAYECIVNGAKYEKGDPVFDWVHNYRAGNATKFIAYAKSKDFKQYIHDFKIWNLSKYVLKVMQLDEGEEFDENNTDENGDPINWILFHYYDKLFKDYYMWRPTKSRLQFIVEKVDKDKKSFT